MTRLSKLAFLVGVVGWSLWGWETGLAVEREALEAALASISAGQLQGHVDVLADDTLEGREAGSRGGRAAGGYLVKHFAAAQLTPLGEDRGYYQTFQNGYRNILGLLEGSDDRLKHEIVLVGAHYDHVGYGSRTTSLGPIGHVHNGADDNASGTACLLELLDAFSALPERPKRSILFAFWDGEEKGLLGSQHWVAAPTVPLDRIVFAFNVDMVGRLRDDRVEVYGSRTARGLRQLVSRHNEAEKLRFDFTWEMKANSDHHPFFARQIPVIMWHTGLHGDYHRPSDDADKINADGIERISRVAFRTVCDMADSPTAPTFRAASRGESPPLRTQFEQPAPPSPPRLGAGWTAIPDEGPNAGVRVSHVVPNSPAARVKLAAGDRIVALNGTPVTDENRLRIAVLAAKSPIRLTVKRAGRDESEEIAVDLNGDPVRVGLTWKEDDAEPGAVLVTMVVPASAAHLAGLQARDRVFAVNSRPFANGDEFHQRVISLPGPLELAYEREGRIGTAVLTVVDSVE